MLTATELDTSSLSGDGETLSAKSARPAAEILADYRQLNPYRPLDWRWKHAAELLRCGEEPDSIYDDRWSHQAFQFRQASGGGSAESLAKSFPDICAALEVQTSEGRPRWELQARILARESADSIETKTGIASSVVQSYEKLFFAVLDRIKNPTYIESAAIGPVPFASDNVGAIWNYCGYWFGPCLLDEIIADFHQTGRQDYTNLVSNGDWWKSRSRFQRLLDRTIGLLLFRPSIQNLSALLRLQRAVMIISQSGEAVSQHEDIQEWIDEAMFELFSTISDDDVAEEEFAA